MPRTSFEPHPGGSDEDSNSLESQSHKQRQAVREPAPSDPRRYERRTENSIRQSCVRVQGSGLLMSQTAMAGASRRALSVAVSRSASWV